MKNYRFTQTEIENMKDFILLSIKNETITKTAWRARLCYEMQSNCSSTKKSRERGERLLALYNQLTKDDLPNWLPTEHTTQPMAATTEHDNQTVFYVYAGYYELYITTEPLDAPRVYQTEFDTIDDAINYCLEIDDTIIYCDNVKDYLPDYLYDSLQEQGYEFYKPKAA